MGAEGTFRSFFIGQHGFGPLGGGIGWQKYNGEGEKLKTIIKW
jgi:hypothetical protein